MSGIEIDGDRQRINGAVIATVRSLDDPDGEGKVLLDMQTQKGRAVLAWAPVAAAMAGKDRGFWSMPEEGDEVLVGFLYGDPQAPYVLGSLWNGADIPPSTSYRERLWRSLNGHTIRLIDAEPQSGSAGAVVIEDAHGNVITMSNGKVTIKAAAILEFDAQIITMKGHGWRRVVTPNSNPI